MRFHNVIHKHYCGIDLHARNMYTCVLDQEGKTLLHRDLPTDLRRGATPHKAWYSGPKPLEPLLVEAA
ncbi:MAG TPA: hypothetical protein VIG29_06260, partial [Vicinamibacteria bacterium]